MMASPRPIQSAASQDNDADLAQVHRSNLPETNLNIIGTMLTQLLRHRHSRI